MTADPDRRVDGLCAREGCGKRLAAGPPKSMPKHLRETFVPVLAADPFCSGQCARAHHKVPGPADYAIGSGLTIPFATTPTRLQRARLEVSAAARAEVVAGKRPSAGLCEMCGVELSPTDTLGRDVAAVRRFCSEEHQRRFHQIYKRQAA